VERARKDTYFPSHEAAFCWLFSLAQAVAFVGRWLSGYALKGSLSQEQYFNIHNNSAQFNRQVDKSNVRQPCAVVGSQLSVA
jgi:hypothetical protein